MKANWENEKVSLFKNLLLAGVAAASLSGMAYAANDMSPEAIAERTKPVGSVYTAADLEGIVDTAAAGDSGEPAAPAAVKRSTMPPAPPATAPAPPAPR
ncbi:hypothetical protein MBH78_04335 [Oceanimonas sp. NS1]|nr:hypothetical protein [Oceanimonas sp. NS1]